MIGLLTIVVLVLILVALTQITGIFNASSEIEGNKANTPTYKDNDTQGKLLLAGFILFYVAMIWSTIKYMPYFLPVSGSEHGVALDNLMAISMAVIIVVFLITQPILFYFAYRYRGTKGRKAEYIEHNNKLELLWTSVPGVVLAGLIIYGLTTWNNITRYNPAELEDPIVVELYAKQFGWTARYAGMDNQLGYANVRLIEGANSLGVDTKDGKSADDIVTTELHLPVGKPVLFKFRSQDVIHSAYMPHFRLQMNCVPGMVTQFRFTPSKTTAEMRQEESVIQHVNRINGIRSAKGEDPYEFDYVLLCNKICGAAHYNMQMKIVVESEQDYHAWLKDQKTIAQSL